MNIGMAGTKLAEFFTKEGIKKAGQQAVKAATSEGVKQAGKRALRDTLLYTAAEQAIPRALGQDAPDIRDTLVRQASGNILAEGVTAGLKGRSFFGEKGMKKGTARKIGEVAGQIGGQAIAQRVLPGEQVNPFVPSTYTEERETTFEASIPLGVGPTTATGATKFTAEPEYNEVVRPSTTDLSNVQASEAMAERERYAYELQLAQIKNQPKHTYMHYDTGNQAAMMGAEMALKRGSSLKTPQYG